MGHLDDLRVRKDGGVELGGLLGLCVEPQHRCECWHRPVLSRVGRPNDRPGQETHRRPLCFSMRRAKASQVDLTWAPRAANVRLSELRDQGRPMTTLDNRPNTALLVIDVQNGVVGDAYERDTVVANVGTVVEKARAAEVPVVWVQHSSDNLAQGSEQWKIVPELSPEESRAARPEAVSGLVRGVDARVHTRRPRRRAPRRRRRADGRMRALDAARRTRPRL